VSYIDGSGAVIARNADGTFSGQAIAAELIKEVRVLRGELDTDSFYSAAIANGIPSELIPDFINAFSYDFNLAAEISPGDTFEVAFEQSVNADGIAVDQPKLLYARLATPEKSAELYQFQVPGEEQGWWNANGASIKRGLMRTPIDGARITSKFGPRFHPVLKYNRLHGGTDFAAPVGTPIYAARDGTVVSASPSSCAGNMVIIDHDNGWQTRYFHLSRYADGLHAGKRVTQGETIGDVGNTGTCTTGPHLHYEVHIDGEKVDPLGVKTDDGERKRIEGADLQRFMRDRDRVDIARARQGY
jgi:murein DD-endopeptidase MepM/ murein hydrolase activator NlpD